MILRVVILLTLSFLCFSCASKKKIAIPIVNHNKLVYKKSNITQKYDSFVRNKGIIDVRQNSTSARDESPKEPIRTSQEQSIIIQKSDTLYSISKKYQVPMRDLIEANRLSVPYLLTSGSHLKIPKPIYYEIKNGDTLYSISREKQMKISDIVTLNNLQKPYKLKAGTLIKIENISKKNIAQDDLSKDNKNFVLTKNNKICSQDLDGDGQNSSHNCSSSAKSKSKNQENLQQESRSTKPISSNEERVLDSKESKNNQFIWPVRGNIISKFGPKKGGLYNDGINVKAKRGTKIKASEDGVVAYVGNELKGYGNLIIIKHSNNWITAYAHLTQSFVKRTEQVKKGQNIGSVGASGNVDSPQLYFGLRRGRNAVNPENFLKKN